MHLHLRVRVFLGQPGQGRFHDFPRLHRHQLDVADLDGAVELFHPLQHGGVHLPQAGGPGPHLFQVRLRLLQLLLQLFVGHPGGQQLILDAVHEHRRAHGGGVELALEGGVLLGFRLAQAAVVDHVEGPQAHEKHGAGQQRQPAPPAGQGGAQIVQRAKADVFRDIEVIDLAGVLDGVHAVKHGDAHQRQHHQAHAALEVGGGGGEVVLQQQAEGRQHTGHDPAKAHLPHEHQHPEPAAHHPAEHRRPVVDQQRRGAQQVHPADGLFVAAHPVQVGVVDAEAQKEIREQAAAQRHQIAQGAQGDGQALKPQLQVRQQKQKQALGGVVAAHLGHIGDHAAHHHNKAGGKPAQIGGEHVPPVGHHHHGGRRHHHQNQHQHRGTLPFLVLLTLYHNTAAAGGLLCADTKKRGHKECLYAPLQVLCGFKRLRRRSWRPRPLP